jgi:hypothetical protein
MRSKQRLMQLAAFCCLAMMVLSAGAAEPESTEFMRFVDDGDNGGTLDTAIVTYRNADGAEVDLVGAVHVADQEYFEGLNDRFTKYDAVLYEMVKPEGADVPRKGAQSDSPVSGLQRMLKNILELDFQLDTIDYTPANFVHADLTAEQFQQLQQDRGESLMALMLRALLNDMKRPRAGTAPLTLQDLLAAAGAPDRGRQLKLLLAPQFQDMEAMVSGFGDASGESVIITERNKAAMSVLKDQLATGKQNVAVFYGAAHFPDMDKRMKEMGFEPVSTEWVVAWDMRKDKTEQPKSDAPVETPVDRPVYEKI